MSTVAKISSHSAHTVMHSPQVVYIQCYKLSQSFSIACLQGNCFLEHKAKMKQRFRPVSSLRTFISFRICNPSPALHFLLFGQFRLNPGLLLHGLLLLNISHFVQKLWKKSDHSSVSCHIFIKCISTVFSTVC